MLEKLLREFLEAGVGVERLAVITAYKGQRAFLRLQLLRGRALPAEAATALEINSIDGFQGREKDFVLISTVRSSPHNGIGFLRDARRLNVALTRARFGLVVVGNADALARDAMWNNYLAHLHARGLIFEGIELCGLKQSVRQFVPRALPAAQPRPGAGGDRFDDSHRVSQAGFACRRD